MYRIQFTALALGILLLLSRGIGLVYPKRFVKWIKEHILSRDDAHLRFYGFAVAIIGALLLYLLLNDVDWLQAITVMLVIMIFVKGLWILFWPESSRAAVRTFVRQSPTSIRILCLIGVIIGIYLIRYGMQALP